MMTMFSRVIFVLNIFFWFIFFKISVLLSTNLTHTHSNKHNNHRCTHILISSDRS